MGRGVLEDLLDKDPVDMKSVETKLKQIETVKTKRNLSFIRPGKRLNQN